MIFVLSVLPFSCWYDALVLSAGVGLLLWGFIVQWICVLGAFLVLFVCLEFLFPVEGCMLPGVCSCGDCSIQVAFVSDVLSGLDSSLGSGPLPMVTLMLMVTLLLLITEIYF